jgi:hypothetical protein
VTFDLSIVNDTIPENTETFYALVDGVRTANGESVNFTLIDVQPFTIEDDDSDNTGGNNPIDSNNQTDPRYINYFYLFERKAA